MILSHGAVYNSKNYRRIMEKMEGNSSNPHCVVLPYPLIGHVNPMFQFAHRLHQKGLQITFLLSNFMAKTSLFSSHTFSLLTYSDGYDDGYPQDTTPDAAVAHFRQVVRTTLKDVLQTLVSDPGRPARCIVYDTVVPLALELADEFGLTAAAFFTQSCAVSHIFHQVYKGDLKVPVPGDGMVLIPGLPLLEPRDLPSFLYVHGSNPAVFRLVVDQFQDLGKAKWLFFNTFYKLEEEVINYMTRFLPVRAIGPTLIPYLYRDKGLAQTTETDICIDWLNQHHPNSVLYVAFGSLAKLGDGQMEELAWGLKLSNTPFIWVVRSIEQSKLPKDFAQDVSDKGLIVPWAPQLDILAHKATCAFFTHCGWNSTLEALSLGVPMVAMPQWSDQTTNSKYMEDVWKMGIRVVVGDNGVVGREVIARCIKEVNEGEKGKEMRRNAEKWKEWAREAMNEDGTSDNNIQEFVSALQQMDK